SARGGQRADQRVGDLRGGPFLYLRSLRVSVDEARELRQAGDPAVVAGDVRDVRAPVERNEVVLADRVERDVADEDHLVVVGFERDDEVARRILREPREDFGVHLGDARGRTHQTVAVGVFPDREQDLAYG